MVLLRTQNQQWREERQQTIAESLAPEQLDKFKERVKRRLSGKDQD